MSSFPFHRSLAGTMALLFLGTSAALAEDRKIITPADVDQHEGVLTGVKPLKNKRWSLTAHIGDRDQTFTMDKQTLAYQLTPRNRQIFTEQDKIDQIVKDANKFRKSLVELKEGELDVVLTAMGQQSTREYVGGSAAEKSERGAKVRSVYKTRGAVGALSQSQVAFTQEEERRRKDYGMPVHLKSGQKVIIYTMKTEDDTLAVLVIGTVETKKEGSPGAQVAGEATRKLKYAKQVLSDGERTLGAEHDRLMSLGRERLREIIKKYPGSPEAEEADKILTGK